MKWLQLLCLLIQTLVDFTKIMLKKTCVDNIWKFCRFMSSGRRNAPDRPKPFKLLGWPLRKIFIGRVNGVTIISDSIVGLYPR